MPGKSWKFLILIPGFFVGCSSIDSGGKSKFQNLWKEPADPPPLTAPAIEGSTPKKK